MMIVGYEIREHLSENGVMIRASRMRAIGPDDPFYETWPRIDGIPYAWDLTYEPSYEVFVRHPNRLMRSLGDTFERRCASARSRLTQKLEREVLHGRQRYREAFGVQEAP